MNRYELTWVIDVWADSPQAAAQQGEEMLRKPGAPGGHYLWNVTDTHAGEQTTIDMLEASGRLAAALQHLRDPLQ